MADHDADGTDSTEPGGLTYKDSGVDIDKARSAKDRIKQLARSTFNDNVVQDIGAFAGLLRADFGEYRKPVLVSSADGVGTKLKIAFLTGIHNTVGVDLVAHCTDDILTQGATPLFFMDYLATGTLDPDTAAEIVDGVSAGCREAGCVLLGGETAEMPDFYAEGEYDLAGFIVGVADEDAIFRPDRVQPGDALIGLPSSGLHTNGFSLVRHLFFERLQLTVDSFVGDLGKTIGEELLTPHRNYRTVLEPLLDNPGLRGLAHVTGGGISENLDRTLPRQLDAFVDRSSWVIPPVFEFIQRRGRIAVDEMYRTFNMGIGMILIVASEALSDLEEHLRERSEKFHLIGEVAEGEGKVRYR